MGWGIFAVFSFLASVINIVHAENVRLKLGVTIPLTGRLSVAGVDTRRGVELALKDFNTSEVSAEAIFEDNQHDTKLAASTTHKLLDQDKVDVIVSMWDMADVVAPLAERKNVPHLSIRWDSEVANRYSTTFTVESTYKSYANSTLALLKRLQVQSVGLLIEEAKGWALAGDYLVKKLAISNIQVVGEERYTASDPDYRTIVLRVLHQKPDVVVLLSNPPHTESLIRRIRELAPAQKFTGYFEILDDLSLIEGIPFVAQFEVQEWFINKFQHQYGSPPKSRSPQAYDIVKLILLAADKGDGKITANRISEVLKNQGDLVGAAGKLHLGGERSIESECVWKIAQSGRFVRYH